jgi:CheY-like chemotaxis protein
MRGTETVLLVDDEDMIMPDMGGRETYDKLKKINPDIKVLLSSGYRITGKFLKQDRNGQVLQLRGKDA